MSEGHEPTLTPKQKVSAWVNIHEIFVNFHKFFTKIIYGFSRLSQFLFLMMPAPSYQSFLTLKLISRFSPPQMSKSGSYVPSFSKKSLSMENNPPAIVGEGTGSVLCFRFFLSRSGIVCQLNCNPQSKPPTWLPASGSFLYENVLSLMMSITGHTTLVLSRAILSSNGSNHPAKTKRLIRKDEVKLVENSENHLIFCGEKSLAYTLCARTWFHCGLMDVWNLGEQVIEASGKLSFFKTLRLLLSHHLQQKLPSLSSILWIISSSLLSKCHSDPHENSIYVRADSIPAQSARIWPTDCIKMMLKPLSRSFFLGNPVSVLIHLNHAKNHRYSLHRRFLHLKWTLKFKR